MPASWPTEHPDDTLVMPEGAERHELDVQVDSHGQVADVRLDGRSIWPTWFKVEWKGNGQVSAKANGLRLSSRAGDRISLHVPNSSAEPVTSGVDTERGTAER